jgi:hypothetical protein
MQSVLNTTTEVVNWNPSKIDLFFCKLQKGCTRLAAASDTIYQLLAYGRQLKYCLKWR